MMRSERILLLAPPGEDEYDSGLRQGVAEPPLGLLYLWSALERCPHRPGVQILDAYVDPTRMDDLESIVHSCGCTQLWVSLMSTEGVRCLGDRISRIRNDLPQVKLVAGGAFFRKLPESDLSRFLAEYDLIVIGDADLEVETILTETGVHRCKPLPSYLELPYPNRDGLPLADYAVDRPPRHVVIGARGCAGNCAFCAISTPRPYLRQPREVVLEMRTLFEKTTVPFYSLIDDVMSLWPDRFAEYERHCKHLPAGMWLDVPWRVDRFSEEIADRLAACGVNIVRFGVESIDPETQNLVGKSFSKDEVRNAVKSCVSRSISPCLYFMFGFAHETEETVAELIEFMGELGTETRVAPYLGIVRILKGTRLATVYQENGWMKDGVPKRGVPLPRLLEVLDAWRNSHCSTLEREA